MSKSECKGQSHWYNSIHHISFIYSALTSKPDWNLLGIIELGTEEFVKRCIEDVMELEERLDDELQVELDDAAVCWFSGFDWKRWNSAEER